MQKCTFNEDKLGTGPSWGLSPALCPLRVRPSRTRGSWSFSSSLGFHCLGPAPLPKTCVCLAVPYVICLQDGTALATLWRIAFGSAEDCWPQSRIHAMSAEVTLTNWGYFLIEVYQGDTVTSPQTQHRSQRFHIDHRTRYNNHEQTALSVGQATVSCVACRHSTAPCRWEA